MVRTNNRNSFPRIPLIQVYCFLSDLQGQAESAPPPPAGQAHREETLLVKVKRGHFREGCQFKLEEKRVQVPRTALRHEVAFALQVSGLPQRVDQTAVEGAGEVLQLQDDQQVPGGVVTGLGGQHEEDGGGRRL